MDTTFAALFSRISLEGVHFSMPPPNEQAFIHKCDSVVWAFGMIPNFSLGSWVNEWIHDGSEVRGQSLQDFSIYLAGSCRDNLHAQGRGEQDLLKCIHEGFEIGEKL